MNIKPICFVLLGLLFEMLQPSVDAEEQTVTKPNILWLTCEDSGRHLGCYGFPTSVTPNLDRLAAKGTRYRHAWSNSPVCSAARTTIITGCYPASLGAEHHRSMVTLPDSFRLYPQYLRDAGYYCTNNSKTDYNVSSKTSGWWDASHQKAHWRNRQKGQPFFAVFNMTMTHESRMRDEYDLKRDPALTPLPPYHPDTPESRRNWTQYHERITQMDERCGELLAELAEDGLLEETVIFFFSDHGSGLTRNKQTALDSGLGVPFIVYFPEKFRHLAPKDYKTGGVSERLISFVDLAPTLFSIAGIEIPPYIQGKTFAGKFETEARKYVYGFRSRIDERPELVRSISDGRYVYARNFHPEIIYGALGGYAMQTPTARVWRDLYRQNQLPEQQKFFWELKPTEELYDLETDPYEMNNLADSEQHRQKRDELRVALRNNQREIRDVQIFPEGMLTRRSEGTTPYDFGHSLTSSAYDHVLQAAESATNRKTAIEELFTLTADPEEAVRYWGGIGLLLRLADTAGPDGKKPTEATRECYASFRVTVLKLLADSDPNVRIVAAEIAGRFGSDADAAAAVQTLFPLINIETEFDAVFAQTALAAMDFASRLSGYRADLDRLRTLKFSGRGTATGNGLINSIFEKQQP